MATKCENWESSPHHRMLQAELCFQLCALHLGAYGGLSPGPVQAQSPPTSPLPPRKKHWSASWTVLEGGVLTFFKDSKASAAGGLVRLRVPGQGPPTPSNLLLTSVALYLIWLVNG